MGAISRERFIEKYSKAINEGYAAVFAGAGLSISSGYVDWKTLVTPFAKELGLNIDEEYDLTRVAQYYRNEFRNRGQINQEIVDKFSADNAPNINIEILTRLPIYTYWTTNYDKLLEKGLENNDRRVDVKITETQLITHKYDRDAILYKMHGDVDDAANAVLTKEDYEVYTQKSPLFARLLQGDLISKTFLFIGFSFEDPNLTNVLTNTRNILGENVGVSYWLEKKVTEPSRIGKSEDEVNELTKRFEIDTIKQNLKVNELQRYGIQTVFIDSYDEITDILKELEFINLKRKLFISGSISFYNDIWTKEKVNSFCHTLAKTLVKNDYQICSGFGYGVGSSIINGALEEIYSTKYKHVDEHLILRPFPQDGRSEAETESIKRKYRTEMINDVGVAIFLFGNRKADNGDKELSKGLFEEFKIAKEQGKIIVPIGSTGEAAKEIFEEIEKNIENYSYLREYLPTLKDSTNERELVSTIEKILKGL